MYLRQCGRREPGYSQWSERILPRYILYDERSDHHRDEGGRKDESILHISLWTYTTDKRNDKEVKSIRLSRELHLSQLNMLISISQRGARWEECSAKWEEHIARPRSSKPQITLKGAYPPHVWACSIQLQIKDITKCTSSQFWTSCLRESRPHNTTRKLQDGNFLSHPCPNTIMYVATSLHWQQIDQVEQQELIAMTCCQGLKTMHGRMMINPSRQQPWRRNWIAKWDELGWPWWGKNNLGESWKGDGRMAAASYDTSWVDCTTTAVSDERFKGAGLQILTQTVHQSSRTIHTTCGVLSVPINGVTELQLFMSNVALLKMYGEQILSFLLFCFVVEIFVFWGMWRCFCEGP